MSYLKDFRQHHLTIRKRYWLRELLNPFNYRSTWRHRRERIAKGWSRRDAWNGGEHIAEVAMGILRELGAEQNPIDWDEYFRMNYPDNYGYNTLGEVADDLQLYLDWDIIQYEEPLYSELDTDTRIAIDIQVYEQAKNAMHFVAQNIGHLWW